MHNKGLNLLVFVVLMGPLIWFSQRMHWGDTGTFVCVVVGIVLGFFILVSGKHVTRNVRNTFGNSQAHAAPDFLFGPADPVTRQQEMMAMRQHIGNRTGQWNAPSLQQTPPQPMMPHPAKRPGSYEPAAYQPQVTRVIPEQQMPAYTLPAMSTRSPQPPQPVAPRIQPQNNGPRLELGPGAQMYLQTSLTGMLVVDAQLRRPSAPIFLEEWIRLGLGILVVDVYGQYTGYLAQMSSFGFLAGSLEGQNTLTPAQRTKYMPIMNPREATHVGQNIVDEGLQIIFNFASYRDTTEAGTYLLALLSGIERKAQEFTTKPCAILFTDVRGFAPANEGDCLIANGGVAQGVFDLLMSMVEHAGQQGLKQLGICLAVPSVEGLEEDVCVTTPLWVVNCSNEEEIEHICRYLELDDQEVDQLLDGDTMLFDTRSDGAANFVRFRRAGIVLSMPEKQQPILAQDQQRTQRPRREIDTSEEGDEIVGGELGLRAETEEQN
jgi:hypothetical protein